MAWTGPRPARAFRISESDPLSTTYAHLFLNFFFFFLFLFSFPFQVRSQKSSVTRGLAIIKSCQNLKHASNLVNMALASRSKIKKSLTMHHTLIKPRKKLVAGYPQKRAKFVLAYLFSLSLKSLFIPGFLLLRLLQSYG